MAQLTRHQTSPVPTAPPRESTGRMLLRALAVTLFAACFGHTALWNLLGGWSAILLGVLVAVTVAAWVPLIVRGARGSDADATGQRIQVAPLAWRRLPWAVLGYLALAGASIAWSQWPSASAATWGLAIGTTLPALFVAHVLTWGELVRVIELALKWIVGLSLALELWAALIVQGPILPNFVDVPEHPDPQIYWTRGDLFHPDARIQGLVGNANVLGIVCLVAVIVIGARMADRRRGRLGQIVWLVITGALYLRAGSATAHVAALVVLAVLVVALLMRRAQTPGARSRLYAVVFATGAVVVVAILALWDQVTDLLGRSDSLSGRDRIWAAVWERATQHPVFGNGFATPWVPWHPAFDGWIVDHHLTVFHAHDMWLDVFMQLGAVGVAVIAVVFGSAAWRAWFFAVDRPRWDLERERPFSALTLVPALVMAALLTQGLTESGPLMLWGWMLLVSLTFRIKLAPIVGVGAAESPRGLPTYAAAWVQGTSTR